MSRRDTIVIAVLLNVGLLAILFMMAINPDEEKFREHTDTIESFVSEPQVILLEDAEPLVKNPVRSTPRDEIDSVLQQYNAHVPSHTLVLEEENAEELEKNSSSSLSMQTTQNSSNEPFVQISVKRGDALEKIARANGISVETLKKVNHLTNERLSIGQTLRIPISKEEVVSKSVVSTKTEEKVAEKKSVATAEPEYYTIKSGDNPWKIAKQFHVKYDEILKLNHLDEEKARNLKVGDKVRVK